MYTQIDRNAVSRGDDLAVLQIEPGGGQLFLQRHAFELRFGQLGAYFFLVLLDMLLQLQAGLDNALLHPTAFAEVFGQLLLHLRQLPLVLHQPIARDVAVFRQWRQIA
ncbi:hypothetical protein D9M69_478900 [compost metagenome]